MGYSKKRTAKVARGYKKFAGLAAMQAGNLIDQNADLQAAILQNTGRGEKPDSRITNPAKAHANEKWELADQWRTQAKRFANAVGDHLTRDITPALAQFAAHGTVFVSSVATLPAMIAECATVIAKLGMVKANGWKMWRLSDGFMLGAKFIAQRAETAMTIEAPLVVENVQVKQTAAEVHSVVAATDVTLCKDEIHRVANAYGLDAGFLSLLVQATAHLHANGPLSLASLATAELSGGLTATVKSGGETKVAGTTLTLVDAAGGTIRMVGGMVMIQPLLRAVPDVPTVFAPVVAPIPLTPMPGVKVVPQYEGVNAQGTSLF